VRSLSVGVVGHVEWVQFGHVDHVPVAGEVVHAEDPFEEPAGGGAVAAVQLARLAGSSVLFTALGPDGHGERARKRLRELGVEVHAAEASEPTRRALTLIDAAGERTITTLGERLEPHGESTGLDWAARLPSDGIYFTAGDGAALALARGSARVLVASPRARAALGQGVRLDALVLSGGDPIERAALARAQAEADVVVVTEGARGGSYRTAAGVAGRWAAATPVGPKMDAYGCGDSFAAGLTFGLAAELGLPAALALAARCGATCLTGRGPYSRQLSARELDGGADV